MQVVHYNRFMKTQLATVIKKLCVDKHQSLLKHVGYSGYYIVHIIIFSPSDIFFDCFLCRRQKLSNDEGVFGQKYTITLIFFSHRTYLYCP
jgi:hypothetical protein